MDICRDYTFTGIHGKDVAFKTVAGYAIMSAIADTHPVAFIISVCYTIGDYKSGGFTTDKIIMEQISKEK